MKDDKPPQQQQQPQQQHQQPDAAPGPPAKGKGKGKQKGDDKRDSSKGRGKGKKGDKGGSRSNSKGSSGGGSRKGGNGGGKSKNHLPCMKFNNEGCDKHEKDCLYSHRLATPEERAKFPTGKSRSASPAGRRGACFAWFRDKSCRYGNACKFSHGSADAPAKA